MAKTITRQTLLQFGSAGAASNFGQFGSQAAGSPVNTKTIATIQSLAAWVNGWQSAVAIGQAPYLEDMNALFYVLAYQQFYQLQEGMPEWDAGTTYYIASIVKRPNAPEYYSSLTDANLNNALPTAGASNASWQFLSGFIGGVFRISGVLAMNAQKITGLAAATTAGDALRYEQLFSGAVLAGSLGFTDYSLYGTLGTATNNNAPAGCVGEYVSNRYAGALTAASNTFGSNGFVTVTAGDWDVSAMCEVDTPMTTVTRFLFAVSIYAGNTTTDHVVGDNLVDGLLPTAAIGGAATVANYRVSCSTTTVVYAKPRLTFTGSPTVTGRISARRVR